jgi:hypothetical protein
VNARRVVAIALLCSCAPAVTQTPSSLPFVRIDTTLTGHVMSRDAAIVVATRRIEDKKQCDARIVDCEAKVQSEQKARASETARADRNQRAATLAIVFSVLAGAIGFGAGFGLGFGLKAP